MVNLVRNLFKGVLQAPSTTPSERIYAIGDVHGRLDLLKEMLKRVREDIALRGRYPTRVVFLGDLIDRGPSSRQLVEFVRALQSRNPPIIAMSGTHEEMLLKSAECQGMEQEVWVGNGGDATLQSYFLDPTEFMQLEPGVRGHVLTRTVGAATLEWLSSLPLNYRSGDYFFCLAGVRPCVPLDLQRREDLLWIRKEFLASRRYHGAVIVHGHSEAYEVDVRKNRINVDTAAYLTDQLTAVGLQGTARWFLSTMNESRSDALTQLQ
jgi:serine/threonine protein phosphatase 1